MAERRMFAKKIIDSDAFLDMPLTTQALYFHLSMRADDDGFINNPKRIQRAIGCSDDDMKLLIAKQYIIPFESGVVVIKHWKIHNYIQNDRYNATYCIEEKSQLEVTKNKEYILTDEQCIRNGYIPDTQVRLGKDSLVKNNIVEKSTPDSALKAEFEEIWKEYPKKEGKTNAEKDYLKARKEGVSQDTILDGIRRYREKVKGEETRYILNGSTYFHQRRWEDEYTKDNKENFERNYKEDIYENIYGEE